MTKLTVIQGDAGGMDLATTHIIGQHNPRLGESVVVPRSTANECGYSRAGPGAGCHALR